jgi:hypothetical protein
LLQTSVGAYATLAIGGRVTIGIVACSDQGQELRSHGASRASLSQQGKLQQARELCCTASRKFRHGHLKEKKGLLEKAVSHTIEHPQEVYRCNYFNQRQE